MKNKRILVLGIALILTAMIVGAAFSEEQQEQEHEYTVEVMYQDGGYLRKVTYTIWASSNDEARTIATERCTYEKGKVASCGAAIATGRTR